MAILTVLRILLGNVNLSLVCYQIHFNFHQPTNKCGHTEWPLASNNAKMAYYPIVCVCEKGKTYSQVGFYSKPCRMRFFSIMLLGEAFCSLLYYSAIIRSLFHRSGCEITKHWCQLQGATGYA